MLMDVENNMEEIRYEKQQILSKWRMSVVVLEKRDVKYKELEVKLNEVMENIKNGQVEMKRCHKDIDEIEVFIVKFKFLLILNCLI